MASASAGAAMQCLILGLVIAPFIGCLVAIVLLWQDGIGSVEVGTLAAMYVLTTSAITVGSKYGRPRGSMP